MARLELTVLFEEVLDTLQDLRLAPGTEPRERRGNCVLGLETLPVTFTPGVRR